MASPLDINTQSTSLQESIYKLNFDISDKFYPDNEITKNIILSKNPLMKKSDADLMIDGYSQTGTQSVADAKLKAQKDYGGRYPISPSTYSDEVKKLKSSIRESSMQIVKESEAIVQEVILVSIKIGASVPAMTLLIAPTSFNVPGAISVVMLIIGDLNKLIDRMMNVAKLLPPLTKLGSVMDVVKELATGDKVTRIYISILILIYLLELITLLKKFIDSLMSQLQSAIVHAPTQSGTYSAPPLTTNGVFDKSLLSTALNNIDPGKIHPTISSIQQITNNLEEYVYDVKLPNGSSIDNLTDEQLEKLKQTYTLVYDAKDSV